jgi:VanZ family protein
MGAIFVVSGTSSPPRLPSSVSDVAAHAVAYAVLGVAMLWAVTGGNLSRITAGGALLAVLLTVFYGVTDEIHQSFVPGRTPELRDLAADAVGAGVGAALGWAWSIVLAVRARRHAG